MTVEQEINRDLRTTFSLGDRVRLTGHNDESDDVRRRIGQEGDVEYRTSDRFTNVRFEDGLVYCIWNRNLEKVEEKENMKEPAQDDSETEPPKFKVGDRVILARVEGPQRYSYETYLNRHGEIGFIADPSCCVEFDKNEHETDPPYIPSIALSDLEPEYENTQSEGVTAIHFSEEPEELDLPVEAEEEACSADFSEQSAVADLIKAAAVLNNHSAHFIAEVHFLPRRN